LLSTGTDPVELLEGCVLELLDGFVADPPLLPHPAVVRINAEPTASAVSRREWSARRGFMDRRCQVIDENFMRVDRPVRLWSG
jgi:hypothetical protein